MTAAISPTHAVNYKVAGPRSMGMTAHELSYLLSLSDSESTAETRVRLMLPAGTEADALAVIGAATLVVRGLGRPAGDKLDLADHSRFLALVCAHAQTWIEVGMATDNHLDGFLVVQDSLAAMIFTPGPFSIYDVVAVDDLDAVPAMVAAAVCGFLAGTNPRSAVLRRHRLDSSVGIVARATDGTLEVSFESMTSPAELAANDTRRVTAGDLMSQLIALLVE